MGEKQNNLNLLYSKIKKCKKCRLYKTRKNVVCGEGDENSTIFIVAQAPGKEEDKKGKILIGPAGKIFNNLLNIARIKREKIFLTNLIKCFLPKYRRPKWDEIFKCREYLFEEIKIINPELIVPLGYYSTRVILEYYNFPIPERRNQYNKIFGSIFTRHNLKIFPLPHPALIFHAPERLFGVMECFRKLSFFYADKLEK